MSFLDKISYQLKKIELRNVELIPVDRIIFSENSSEHWPHLPVERMNVLDLGIGRWGISDLTETSPVYFKSKNARKIVGVDSNHSEVEFFRAYFEQNIVDESIFIRKHIDSPGDILTLIVDHDINAIKCDIEGAEEHLFSLRLKELLTLNYLSIEYHSPVLLRQLLRVNSEYWKFTIMNHSIFSKQPEMGVVTLSRLPY